jgi:hypothetical protein
MQGVTTPIGPWKQQHTIETNGTADDSNSSSEYHSFDDEDDDDEAGSTPSSTRTGTPARFGSRRVDCAN